MILSITGIWNSFSEAAIFPKPCCCTTWTISIQDGMHAGFDCKEPQATGMFTPYSQSLESVALRKRVIWSRRRLRTRGRQSRRQTWHGRFRDPPERQRLSRPGSAKYPSPNSRPRGLLRAATSIRASSGSLFRVRSSASAQRREEMIGSKDRDCRRRWEMLSECPVEIGEGQRRRRTQK